MNKLRQFLGDKDELKWNIVGLVAIAIVVAAGIYYYSVGPIAVVENGQIIEILGKSI